MDQVRFGPSLTSNSVCQIVHIQLDFFSYEKLRFFSFFHRKFKLEALFVPYVVVLFNGVPP